MKNLAVLKKEPGFTLLEVMLTITIMGITSGMIYSALDLMTGYMNDFNNITLQAIQGKTALDYIARDIREADSVRMPGKNTIELEKRNGRIYRYYLDNGNLIAQNHEGSSNLAENVTLLHLSSDAEGRLFVLSLNLKQDGSDLLYRTGALRRLIVQKKVQKKVENVQ